MTPSSRPLTPNEAGKSRQAVQKDLKRYVNQPIKLKKLYQLVDLLRRDIPLPATYRPHRLIGDYAGYMECHIEGDFLWIWYDKEADIVKLIRLGNHYELFG